MILALVLFRVRVGWVDLTFIMTAKILVPTQSGPAFGDTLLSPQLVHGAGFWGPVSEGPSWNCTREADDPPPKTPAFLQGPV